MWSYPAGAEGIERLDSRNVEASQRGRSDVGNYERSG